MNKTIETGLKPGLKGVEGLGINVSRQLIGHQ
jgi:hypothetical protein